MVEIAERVANLKGRVDMHTQDLVRVGDAVASLESKVERQFEMLRHEMNTRFLQVEAGLAELRGAQRSDVRAIMGAIAGAVITVLLAMFAQRLWWN